jgi:pimeloyl-ACP methyl ester carboxylesterase
MGHSLGGYLALQYTKNHPDRIDKLILLNSFGGICASKDYIIKKKLEEYPEVETFSKYFLPKEIILKGLESIMVSPPKDAELIFDILSVRKRRVYGKYVGKTFANFDRNTDFSELSQKKLIITSDLDNIHTPCEAENLAQRLSNDTLVIIKGAKHASIRDKLEEIIQLVEKFLRLPILD